MALHQDLTSIERVGLHSHVTGLGLDDNYVPINSSDGLVGQITSRKALGMVLRLARNNYSCPVILSGPPGSGKTALACGLIKEMEAKCTFLNACELRGKNTVAESLIQAARSCVSVEINEEYIVVEGEVVSIERGLEGGRITLKTADMESVFETGSKMMNNVLKEGVEQGDVIRVNKTTGKLSKIGKVYQKSGCVDARIVKQPEGELTRVINEVSKTDLHEIDLVSCKMNPLEVAGEIPENVMEEVNNNIKRIVCERRATVRKGVLVVDEVHALSPEEVSAIIRVVEQEYSPLVLLITNRDVALLPKDLLSRSLIIRTSEYNRDDLCEIIKLRCAEEGVKIKDDGLERAALVAKNSGIRTAMNLITLCGLGSISGGKAIGAPEINSVAKLFSIK